uniref:Retrovirus-related Pol polyprotein n=1 Tax=Anoplophora glabripennis TaxID=217634 RepID=V5GV43_ANOGL
MVRLTLKKTENKVKVNNRCTEEFEVKNGVRQGDPLSAVLFSLVLEKVIRDAGINRSGLIYYKRHQCLAFADDLVVLARNKAELKEVIRRIDEQSIKRGLYINETKTKYMEWSEEEYQKDKFLKVDTNRGKTYRFEEVEHFTYLGTLFRRPKIEEEIEARIMLGNKSVAGLQRILRNKNVSRQTKIRLYKTVITPVVTYASETWTLNKAEQTRLEVWERKILRKIFGGKRTEEGWFRRTNEEIKSLY